MIPTWVFLVVFSLVLHGAESHGCGVSQKSARPQVMGGKTAPKGMYPWMVAITKKSLGKEYLTCTGFLISKKYFLSAAHCFTNPTPSLYAARIGDLEWQHGKRYAIQNIAVHKRYIKNYDDIALVTLKNKVTDPRVSPICLANSHIKLNGQKTTIAGWGRIKSNGTTSRQLQHLGGMTVFSNKMCSQILIKMVGSSSFYLEFPQSITKNIICAGYLTGGKDSCMGDSGGPLMYQYKGRWIAVGIVAFGYGCGNPGYPGGYTRVSKYISWIKKQIG